MEYLPRSSVVPEARGELLHVPSERREETVTEPFLISPLSAVPETVTLDARKMLNAESADLSEPEFVH